MPSIVLLLAGCGGEAPTPLGPDVLFGTGSPEEIELAQRLAWDHIEAEGDRFDPVGELQVEHVVIDELATAHVRYRQVHDGVEVFGGQLFLHLDPQGEVRGTTNLAYSDIQPVNQVLYTADEALEFAAIEAGGWETLTSIRDNRLMVDRHDGIDRYVYVVELERFDHSADTAMPVLFIDAGTAEVVWQYDNLQTATGTANTLYNGSISFPISDAGPPYRLVGEGIGTYTFNNAFPPWNGIVEGDLSDLTSTSTVFSGDPQGPDAQFGIAQTVDYFLAAHGRSGMDGLGGPLPYSDGVVTGGVNYGTDYVNAFWNGEMMVFGDGDLTQDWGPVTSLDVAAHELTHGVTEFSADMIYTSESGAVNESYSDVFAALVEAYVEGENPSIWLIGEDVITPGVDDDEALRYMNDPALDRDSAEHYDVRYLGTADNGGVHWNSGISNLAFYLMVEGGSHPNPAYANLAVDAMGLDRAAQIWYRALTTYMGNLSGFQHTRVAQIAAAEDLFGVGSFEAQVVADAWTEVGVVGIDGSALISGARRSWTYYTVDVPADAQLLRVNTWGITGDADLYTRFGSQPDSRNYDCRPYLGGSNEECVHVSPAEGTWHIGVFGYSAYQYVLVEVNVIEACDPAGEDDLGGNCDDLDAECGTEVSTGCTPSLAITEIFPAAANGSANAEWIEILNTGAETVDLYGAQLTAGSDTWIIDDNIVLAPGDYALLAGEDDPQLDGDLFGVDAEWGAAISLGDSGDTIVLAGSAGTVLDTVTYGSSHTTGTSMPVGASLSVDPAYATATSNDVATAWCDGRASFGDGFGTPGEANQDCGYTLDVGFAYDLDNGDDDGLEDDVVGQTTLTFWFDGSGRGFYTGNGGDGDYHRTSTASGQSLSATYNGTGVTYTATRDFTTDGFSGGPIVDLPSNAISGSWVTPP